MSAPYRHIPLMIQTDPSMPLDQVMQAVAGKANELSACGFEVILPAMPVPTGSRLIGSEKSVLWVFWARWPANQPMPLLPNDLELTKDNEPDTCMGREAVAI